MRYRGGRDGAGARGVSRGGSRAPADSRTSKQGAATKKQTLTAATFDQQVASKIDLSTAGVSANDEETA